MIITAPPPNDPPPGVDPVVWAELWDVVVTRTASAHKNDSRNRSAAKMMGLDVSAVNDAVAEMLALVIAAGATSGEQA